MAHKTIIAETEQVSAIQQDIGGDTVVVTFNEMGFVRNGTRFWGDDFLLKHGLSAIGIVTPRPNWYPPRDMNEVIPAVLRQINGRRVITYGFSHGAFGALKFSRRLNASVALCFCPQWSINPDAVRSFDTRTTAYFDAALDNGGCLEAGDVCKHSFIFYDKREPSDARHVAILSKYDGVYPVLVPFALHNTIRILTEGRGATRIIDLCRNAIAPTVCNLRKIVRQSRRHSKTYHDHMIRSLILRMSHSRSRSSLFLDQAFARAGHQSRFYTALVAYAKGNAKLATTELSNLTANDFAGLDLLFVWGLAEHLAFFAGEALVAKHISQLQPTNTWACLHAVKTLIRAGSLEEAEAELSRISYHPDATEHASYFAEFSAWIRQSAGDRAALPPAPPASFTLPIIFRGHDEPGFFAHAIAMNPRGSPLRLLPGNKRTNDDRYACLIVVKDYFRMRAVSRGEPARWHYSEIEPEILADVRAGRAVVVFDFSNEGPSYDPVIFNELYGWIEANRLPPGRCIWLSQNRLMAASATAHAGQRAALVHFDRYDFFIKLIAWKFSRWEIEKAAGDDPDTYLSRIADIARKDKLLLCLNATPRLGRVLTLAALHHHQLMDRSLVSFPGMNYVKSGNSLSEVLAFLDRNPALESLRPWVRVVERMAPIRVDTFQEQGNALVEKIDHNVYQRTFFSLVTESDYPHPSIERVTEKTIKAYCMGHPTLIVGNPRSFEIARDYGFHDWTGVLNPESDFCLDAADRFTRVMADVLRQVERITADPGAWLNSVREISVFNHRYAIGGGFLNRYIDKVDQYLVTKLCGLVQSTR